jgi:aldehyde:ferredoxin oxidoreductase
MANKSERKLSSTSQLYGYAGNILRVDLSKSKANPEPLDEATVKDFVGGAALGMKYIYDEVPPGVRWNSPENRLFIGSGPLGGSRVGGSGSISVSTKGALTEGMASTQANGFFGAFLRFSGFDAIIIQGAAPEWTYLYVHDGTAELRDASHLLGKDTIEIDKLLKAELNKGEHDLSVLCIGLAGEHLVRLACISTDRCHMAAHNGVGAVMGSKKLKAIAVARSKNALSFYDNQVLAQAAKGLLDNALNGPYGKNPFEEGTVGLLYLAATGLKNLPIKNYTTGVNPLTPDILDTYDCKYIRARYNAKWTPCWACRAKHCHMMEIPEGKYAGRKFEEPEYEGMAACSALTGIHDLDTTMLLNSEVDRLGMDVNECGYVMSWVMECYEKHILTSKDTDGIEMTWGNGAAIMTMLNKMARREGFGNLLAEGVMRASRKIGGEAVNMAVHTEKGNTPRGHDHRVVWQEMFDTVVSNTGTLESHVMSPFKLLGIESPFDAFDPMVISTVVAKVKGAMIFEDSMVTCRYNTVTALELLCNAVNAATGWNLDFQDAMKIGKRAVNVARAFNISHGISPELDKPSMRYGSTPLDGKAAGIGIMPHFDKMLGNYYSHMGWDKETGKPLPETLKDLGLDYIIPRLYQ